MNYHHGKFNMRPLYPQKNQESSDKLLITNLITRSKPNNRPNLMPKIKKPCAQNDEPIEPKTSS